MSSSMAALGLELGVRTKRARRSARDAVRVLQGEISEIEKNAREAASALQDALEQGGGAEALRMALSEQERSMLAFAREMEELVAEQAQLVEGLSRGCIQITQVHVDMQLLAHEARLLAVNTAVSASRLGDRGATVASVAEHMQALSVEVAHTSEDLAARVDVMRTQLPMLQSTSAEMMLATQELEQEIQSSQAEFGEHTRRIAAEVSVALVETRERVAELRASGDAARFHLRAMGGLDEHLDRLQDMGLKAVFVGSPQDLLRALEGGTSHAGEPARQEEASLESGEMLLF